MINPKNLEPNFTLAHTLGEIRSDRVRRDVVDRLVCAQIQDQVLVSFAEIILGGMLQPTTILADDLLGLQR